MKRGVTKFSQVWIELSETPGCSTIRESIQLHSYSLNIVGFHLRSSLGMDLDGLNWFGMSYRIGLKIWTVFRSFGGLA